MDLQLEKILQRTLELYNQRGIRSATMDDVARFLGISKKTLYQHVKEKKELVELALMRGQDSVWDCVMQELNKDLNAIEELFSVNRLMHSYFAKVNPTFLFDLEKYYPLVLDKLKERKRDLMYRYISANIEKGQAQGLFRADMNADLITRLHMTRLEATTRPEIFTKEECHSESVFNEIFIYHIRGMATDKGIAFLEEKLNESDFYQSK